MKNTKTSAKHSKPKEKRPLFGQRRRAEELPGAQPQAQPDGGAFRPAQFRVWRI
ncbi:MAG: hypothetical protein MR633_07995 [Faecalibacterium prausnitzii]|nr:hypothetical protein [Faecalibacterium prausnitzii]